MNGKPFVAHMLPCLAFDKRIDLVTARTNGHEFRAVRMIRTEMKSQKILHWYNVVQSLVVAIVKVVPRSPVRSETSVVFIELPTATKAVPYMSMGIRQAKGRRSADKCLAMVAPNMFDGLSKIHGTMFSASISGTCIGYRHRGSKMVTFYFDKLLTLYKAIVKGVDQAWHSVVMQVPGGIGVGVIRINEIQILM